MIPTLSANAALSCFVFGFLVGAGWTLGAWLVSTILGLIQRA